MQYPPATLEWRPVAEEVTRQWRLRSPEWLWDLAQVVRHPSGAFTSRVGLHRRDALAIGIDAPNERLAKRWAELWVRRNWPRIEREMIDRGNSSAYRRVNYEVFAGRGLAPPAERPKQTPS